MRNPFPQGEMVSRILMLLVLLLPEIRGNEVVGEPYVNCAADAIYVKARTSETFAGHVNLRFAPNKYCYQVLVTNNQIEVLIPHQECALARRRTHTPDGVVIRADLIISFHPDFITKDDRTFRFECIHTRKEGNTQLETGTHAMSNESPPNVLSCQYRILKRYGGLPVRSVTIGDRVFHEWKCENGEDRCLNVRNCKFVTSDSKFPLTNQDGCSLDTTLVPNLHHYNESYVGQDFPVFGVSGKPVVYFSCEISMDEKVNGTCERAICGEEKQRIRRSVSPLTSNLIEIQSQRIEISELNFPEEKEHETQSLSLLDATPSPEPIPMECSESSADNSVCLSRFSFVVVMGSTLFVAVCTLLVVFLSVCQKMQYTSVQEAGI